MKTKPICKTYSNGIKHWYLNGKFHREDGPAIEHADGYKAWYLNDKCHREDGPAVERANGDKLWFLNDKLHKEDGPAVEYADGDKYWYLFGIEYSEPDFYRELYKKGKITKEELFIHLL